MHTSYFLFVMVITMFCYAVIKGRPSKLRQSNTEFCPEKVSLAMMMHTTLTLVRAERKHPFICTDLMLSAHDSRHADLIFFQGDASIS